MLDSDVNCPGKDKTTSGVVKTTTDCVTYPLGTGEFQYEPSTKWTCNDGTTIDSKSLFPVVSRPDNSGIVWAGGNTVNNAIATGCPKCHSVDLELVIKNRQDKIHIICGTCKTEFIMKAEGNTFFEKLDNWLSVWNDQYCDEMQEIKALIGQPSHANIFLLNSEFDSVVALAKRLIKGKK